MSSSFQDRLLQLSLTNQELDENDHDKFMEDALEHQDVVAQAASQAIALHHHVFLKSLLGVYDFWCCEEVFVELSEKEINFLLTKHSDEALFENNPFPQYVGSKDEALALKMLKISVANPHLFPVMDQDYWHALMVTYSDIGHAQALQWVISHQPSVVSKPEDVDKCCMLALLYQRSDALSVLMPYCSGAHQILKKFQSDFPPGSMMDRQKYLDILQPYVAREELVQELSPNINNSSPSRSPKM